MFRYAYVAFAAIALIAGFNYCSLVGKAGDDVKLSNKEAGKQAPIDDDKVVNPRAADPDSSAKTQSAKTLAEMPYKEVISSGPDRLTIETERPSVGGLIWLARHQLPDGSWSLHDYTRQCKDKTCTGQSDISSDAGATALGLLPFLGAGQTHRSKGPYQEHVLKAIVWLVKHQQADGNLAKGSKQLMYGHGLATIALSEAYGMTGDRDVGIAAQKAVNFIIAAQNRKDGGWRYNPKDPGDTCVLGWQLTALKSAHMAGLDVGGDVFKNASSYLDSVAIHDGTEYGYQPGMVSSPTMSAVGLLGREFLGAKRDNPMLVGGIKYLLNHLPDENTPNIYYWYYATQVMHNMRGAEWDAWNRKMRDVLVRSQVRNDTCAAGSWDPAKDVWGKQGGRLMETSLATLTLEVYYRYLPIFKTEVMLSPTTDNGNSERGNEPELKIVGKKGVDEKPPEKMDIDKMEKTPPPVLDVDPTLEKPAQAGKEAEHNDDSKLPTPQGGKANANKKLPEKMDIGEIEDTPPLVLDVDPALEKPAMQVDNNDDGKSFGHSSGTGSRQKMIANGGGTWHTERAVAAALLWLAHHQESNGHWGLSSFVKQCKDKTCTGVSEIQADAGATAMGLLPFLAAGQTHKSKGAYRETILKGVQWLIRNQQPDGNLAKGAQQMMYSHGLATIALCESYGLTGDHEVGKTAQKAVDFIISAQNAADGGWRYNPKDAGDTSVVGWQMAALKSAQMAGLDVGTSKASPFSGASRWLDWAAVHDGTEYAYQPGQSGTPTMTAEGLLCRQYLGAKRDNPMLVGGMKYLMGHLPDDSFPNIYYWYHATQVMHNMSGNEWDAWNRKMRAILVRTQVRDATSCANGSWPPEKDAWGRRGGRVMQTALSALTLEIYYRYLPLYKIQVMTGEKAEKGVEK
jgi:hypothetical protein